MMWLSYVFAMCLQYGFSISHKLGANIYAQPILSKDGRVEGVLTARDINDFAVAATEKGGKKQYLKDISQRVGLGSETSMAEPPTYLKGTLALDQLPLYVTIGQAELPHPFKANGSESSERGELCGDKVVVPWTV